MKRILNACRMDSLLCVTTYSSERWLIRTVLHHLTDVIVLEPAYVAAKVKQTALDIAGQYGMLDKE
ncbi:hypothetical protein [Paenibacillus sp. SN-8-1]|uniref:hypothetical protein n=1 Tax=Paenibacillus sp. SN-8-1 TaxID=3435409 RepID=UPI003D9A52E6